MFAREVVDSLEVLAKFLGHLVDWQALYFVDKHAACDIPYQKKRTLQPKRMFATKCTLYLAFDKQFHERD
jgi:hypothetical protein